MSSWLESLSAPLAQEEDFTCDLTTDENPESAREEDDLSTHLTKTDDGHSSPCENNDRESAVDTETGLSSHAAHSHSLDERGDMEPHDSTDNMNGESADSVNGMTQNSLSSTVASTNNTVNTEDSANREPVDLAKHEAVEAAASKDEECVDSTTGSVGQDSDADDSAEKTKTNRESDGGVKQDSVVVSTGTKIEESSVESTTTAADQDLDDVSTNDESGDEVSGTPIMAESGSTQSWQGTEVTMEDSGGGAERGGDLPSALTPSADPEQQQQQSVPTLQAAPPPHDDAQVSLGETIATQGETIQAGSGEATDKLQTSMDAQGETNAGSGRMNDILEDFFGSSGASDSGLRVNGAGSGSRLDREKSPEIVVDMIDGVENVTLKDATSEKALLGNGDGDGSSVRTDSLGSKTDEEKRKSSSDMDMDFAVLELDSSHLNLDLSKQKTSLRKRGSLARRKKPSRGSGNSIVPGTEDSIFQDSTVPKPVTSPTPDTAEDDVFHTTSTAQPSMPQPVVPSETPGVRKSAKPYKPPIAMPGLQDLSKSKLFSQERHKSGETDSPPSPIKSPLRSPASPANRGAVPPLVLPKPTSKGQKDWQNKTIAAAESTSPSSSSSSHNGDSSATTATNTNNSNNNTALGDLWSSGGRRGRAENDAAANSSNPTQTTDVGPGSGAWADPKMVRQDSWSSVSSPRRLSRGDSMDGEVPLPSTPRRASIQGSAYAPIGFRPRRSSSIVLDANNKLIDSSQPAPAPPSPAPSSASSGVEEERGDRAKSPPPPVAAKSPLYKAPVWLSEMKAKAGGSGAPPGGDSSHPRTFSNGSAEESAASVASSRDRSESAGSTDWSAAAAAAQEGGARGRSFSDEANLKKRGEQEAEKPSWMKAAQAKTSRVADQLSNKKEEANGEDVDDEHPKPQWATGLRKTNRSLVPTTENSGGGGVAVTPLKNSSASDKENQPVASDGRDQYAPSWMKRGQTKKAPVPIPGAAGKGASTNGSGTAENPMKAYETPRWKLDLAEKKKRREAEMQTLGEETGDATDVTSPGAPSSDSPPSDLPQWRKQLSQRKKRSIPGVAEEGESEAGGESPEWARKAEERRQRIIKSGLLEKAAKANGADES